MKYKRNRVTENEGLLYVEAAVNGQGSVYRRVHQETDLGIDGFIEIIKQEQTSGQLVAVQIKSGESYVVEGKNVFSIAVDQKHLDYWDNYAVPVIIIAYSPRLKLAGWVSVRDFLEEERYHGRQPACTIAIPFDRRFDTQAVGNGIAALAHVRSDERILLRCGEKCLSRDSQARHDGFQILSQHPDSRNLKMVALLARHLLMDERNDTAREALKALGYAVGRRLWSWNPHNPDEGDVVTYACNLCQTLTEQEIRRCLELIDDDAFGGPFVLGTYGYLVIGSCESSQRVLWDVIHDTKQPKNRRLSAFWIYYDCEVNDMMEDLEERSYFLSDTVLSELYLHWFPESSPE